MSHWKKELQKAFEAPESPRKRDFLRRLEQPRMGVLLFLLTQVGYIPKWNWCLSGAVFLVALVGAVVLSVDMLWVISALTPMLALSLVTESGRSECYGMAELELATRFSLRSVTLARLCILGVENLLLLVGLVFFGVCNAVHVPLHAGVYILTPFLLTTFTGLHLVRRVQGQEAVYFCVGAAIFISVCVLFTREAVPGIYQPDHLAWWLIGAVILGIGTVKQFCITIHTKEELRWSL